MPERKIGVVVPTFQRRHLVGGTVRSLLHQDLPGELSIAVVDDGSTDGTLERLEEELGEEVRRVEDRLAGTDRRLHPWGRVRLIRQPNRHVAAARNAGLRELLAEGCSLLGHQDSDDLALPHKLRVLAGHLERHPHLGLVHARSLDMAFDGLLLPEGQGPFETWYLRDRPGGALWDRAARGDFRRGELREVNYVHNQTTLYTREALLALGDDGWFPEGVRYGEDWSFYVRLEDAGVGFGFVPRAVAVSRAHASGLSTGRAVTAPVEELLREAREAPPEARADLYLRARHRDPAGFGEALGRLGLAADLAATVQATRASIRSGRAAGRLPEALGQAHRLYLLDPSEETLSEARAVAGELAALLAPARQQALRAGDLPGALGLARQVFTLDPSAEHASALAWIESLTGG